MTIARLGDGNAWAFGRCWLYCRREDVSVLRLGTVSTPHARGDVYACDGCLAELAFMVERYGTGAGVPSRNAPPLVIPAHVPVSRPCAHPVLGRGADGEWRCASCERQIYL
ncbi:hypothetical protein [Streptomyces avicenniae]|uniref:hypothetical protein n=1 Tax=Streptomyces avicenniae TaxID=500153 RepID=UPI00069AC6AC|nr:hypothetical protein [Streptomyces avicenniae]